MKKWVAVKCKSCPKVWGKREDSLPAWRGECKVCSSKTVAQMPHVKEAHRRNGIAVMARVGKLPQPLEKRPRGNAHYAWQRGITSPEQSERNQIAYRQLKRAVLDRDGSKCAACSATEDLEIDHILPWKLFPEKRHDLSNCRILCGPCHRKYGSFSRKGKLIHPAITDFAQVQL